MDDQVQPPVEDNVSESAPLLKSRYPRTKRQITRRKAKGFGNSRRILGTPPTSRANARRAPRA